MFRLVLSRTFATGFELAATVSTTAQCDAVTMVGTFLASCDDGLAMAQAGITAPAFVSNAGMNSFSLTVHAAQIAGPPPVALASAMANFSDDYVFAVSGKTGTGFFCPVSTTSHGGGGIATMTVAGVFAGSCAVFTDFQPFTFGVSQIIAIVMSGSAQSSLNNVSDAEASFDQMVFEDASGRPLSCVTFTLASVDLPENSSSSLIGIGLCLVFATLTMARVRYNRNPRARFSQRR
jgi:NO-binding membrane sensor protein with MHYT domain